MRPKGVARFWIHTVSVETFEGVGSAGDIFVPPVAVFGFLDDGAKLIRNKDGEQVVSTTRFYCDKGNAALFAVNSKVTLPTRTARVIMANAEDSGALGLPDHLVVDLT